MKPSNEDCFQEIFKDIAINIKVAKQSHPYPKISGIRVAKTKVCIGFLIKLLTKSQRLVFPVSSHHHRL